MCLLTNFMMAQETGVSYLGVLLPEFNVKIGKYYQHELLKPAIDLNLSFKDTRMSSPAFHKSVKLVKVRDKRISLAMTEIIFDHFLAFHWEKFNPTSLKDFSEEIFKELKANMELLPLRIKNEFFDLFHTETFSQYSTLRGTAETIKALSRHYPQNSVIGIEVLLSDLYDDYHALKENFFEYCDEVNLTQTVKA